MNWKLFAIIAATAIATAAAVVFLLQRQNDKHRMRFDSTEFDDDDFIGRGEQCSYLDDDLDIQLPDDIDDGEPEEAPAEEAAEADETDEA